MSGDSDSAARFRRWLRWVVHGDRSLDWLRPTRSVLPALIAGTLVALGGLHEPGRNSDCNQVGACLELLRRMADQEPTVLAGAVGLHLLAAALVYVAGVGVTAALGHWVGLESRAPWLFAPDDRTVRAVAVLGLVAVLAYVAGAYGLAYTVVGVGVLYVVYFPVLVVVAGFELYGPSGGPVATSVAVLLLAALPLLQVAWLYALAHLATAPFATDEDAERPVHR